MSSLVEAPTTSGEIAVGYRKERRVVETQEIRIRGTHRRRKVLTRGGVLVGFALAMIVYPVFGTITPYADASEAVHGVVKGQSPTTAMALLGGGPQLVSSDLPLPDIDVSGDAVVMSDVDIVGSELPKCDNSKGVSGSNGRLTAASLCALPQRGRYLQPDAAISFAVMNDYFRSAFGRNICLDDAYRKLSDQYGVRKTRGYLAATPGTSMHGWGLAVDICKEDLKGSAGAWIKSNAATYGWVNPQWAKSSKYEPWHWEYAILTAKYYDSSAGGGNYSDGESSSSSSSKSTTSKSGTSTTTGKTTTTTTEDEGGTAESEPAVSPTAAP